MLSKSEKSAFKGIERELLKFEARNKIVLFDSICEKPSGILFDKTYSRESERLEIPYKKEEKNNEDKILIGRNYFTTDSIHVALSPISLNSSTNTQKTLISPKQYVNSKLTLLYHHIKNDILNAENILMKNLHLKPDHSEAKLLKSLIKNYRDVIKSSETKFEILEDILLPKTISDKFLSLLIIFIKDRLKLIEPEQGKANPEQRIIVRRKVEKRKKTVMRYKTFEEIFRKKKDYKLAIKALQEAEPPVVDSDLNYLLGEHSKGALTALMQALRGKVENVGDRILATLLNKHIKGFRVSDKTLRNLETRTYKLYLRQFSHLRNA